MTKRAICAIYIIINTVIISLLLFVAGSTDYYIKREQIFSNIFYLAIGLTLTTVLFFLISHFKDRIEAMLNSYGRIIITVTLLLFLALSIFICTNGFFFSDWDPASILYAVYGLLNGNPQEVGTTYFSNHPNNLLIVWLYLVVLRFVSIFGIKSVLSLVVFQCLLATISAYIFYKILCDAFGDGLAFPYIGLLAYEVWVVLSPWFIITYSDEIGLIFPLLIIRIYQKLNLGKYGRCILLSVVAAVGYYIKPQIILSYIAVIFVYFISIKKENIKRFLLPFALSAISIVASILIINGAIIPSMGIEIDRNRSFSMAHYFMMGLNNETDGVYSDEDTLFTDSYNSPSEKREADLALAKERIGAYGLKGFLSHAKRKTLVNYNDGLFAWGIDGNFFAGREWSDIGVVPEMTATEFIWSFIMPDGGNHGKYSSIMQMIWLTVLTLGLAGAIILAVGLFIKHGESEADTKENNDGAQGLTVYVVMLSLIGLFLFELLFEAKARYLLIYTPYFLFLAVYALYLIYKKTCNKL